MTHDDEAAAPWNPHEEPPEDDDYATPTEYGWTDPNVQKHADALGITYGEAAELQAHSRDADTEFDEARHHGELVHLGAIPDDVAHLPRSEQIRHAVSASRVDRAQRAGYYDIDAFLAMPEPEYNWLVPGLLERGDRVIVTGEEGKGKSTLLRQMGVQVAAGIHPFTLDEIVPKRVLLLDVENSQRLVRRALRPMRLSAGARLLPGYMVPVIWNAGLDLRTDEDVDRLAKLIDDLGTDLLITGPSYKMASGDPTTEETAKAVATAIDVLRVDHDFAVILEAHQPYAATAGGKRALRPYGASLWSRWPEFGLNLSPTGTIEHWRGDRDERDWPAAVKRGGEWPWTAVSDGRGVTFSRIVDATREAGRKLSLRELADAVGGGSANTMKRAIEANQGAFDQVLVDLENGVF